MPPSDSGGGLEVLHFPTMLMYTVDCQPASLHRGTPAKVYQRLGPTFNIDYLLTHLTYLSCNLYTYRGVNSLKFGLSFRHWLHLTCTGSEMKQHI